MKNPTHEEVTQRAEKIWQDYGRPTGRDNEIWLEAEKQLATAPAESKPSTANVSGSWAHEATRTLDKPQGIATLAEEVREETAAESAVEFHISPPVSQEDAIKAAMQKKQARAPKVPAKTAPKAKPPESGKPVWDRPHSS